MEDAKQAAYQAREKRFEDAVALRKPDRVPVVPVVIHYYATRAAGMSNKDAMLDYEGRASIFKDLLLRLDFDAAPRADTLFPARIMELMGLTRFKWPGGALRDDEPFQFSGTEALKAHEYDEFLADPDGFTLRRLLPQMSTALAPLGQMPMPPLHWLSTDYDLIYALPGIIGASPLLELFKRLAAAGEEMQRFAAVNGGYEAEVRELGYPIAFGGAAITAFDWIGDFFRNMRGVLMDMFRAPEKLLAAIELLLPATIQKGVLSARMGGSNRVFIPLHWGGGGFMSNDQYARFYWPSLKALLLGVIDAGLTPIPVLEGDYTPRLEFLKELPRGKVAGHFDIVDRKKAKDAIGDTMCFWGNVPAALLATGTPQEVKDDVRELIEIFGDTGGLIIDGSGGIPDEARPENLAAMVEAAREFGVY